MHAFSMPYTKRLLMTLVLLMSICAFPGSLPQAVAQETEEEGDPAEITIGERLFLETRFSQFPLYTGEPLPQLSMSKAVSTIPCRRVENPHPTPVL